jgi:hypothetical protein
MDYLDFERLMQALMCVITVMIGIGLAFLIIIYEENYRMVQALNVSGKVAIAYAFPQDTWFNISR